MYVAKSPPSPASISQREVRHATLELLNPPPDRLKEKLTFKLDFKSTLSSFRPLPPAPIPHRQRYLEPGCVPNSLELDAETRGEIARILGRGKGAGPGASLKLLRNEGLLVSLLLLFHLVTCCLVEANGAAVSTRITSLTDLAVHRAESHA